MKRKLLIYLPLGVIILITGIVFYFLFFDHFLHSFNKHFPQELVPPTKDYNDLSASKPFVVLPEQSEYDMGNYSNPSRIYESAQRGFSASSLDQCQDNAYCIGGYAAKVKDQSLCEHHDFKSKYYWYPACESCGIERGKGGNSMYENCYIGYGVINKDQDTCINLPNPVNSKNTPEYPHDRSTISKIKKESCLYGVAIGKVNIEACETTNFFVETCRNGFRQ